jgi:hypothetical protein
VVGITDGDTLSVMHEGVPERVGLHEIDCPERKQAFYGEAKKYAADLAFGNSVHRQYRLIWLILYEGVRYEEHGSGSANDRSNCALGDDPGTSKPRYKIEPPVSEQAQAPAQ